MTAVQTGYSLVRLSDSTELQNWPSIPEPVLLTPSIAVHGASVADVGRDLGGYKIVQRWEDKPAETRAQKLSPPNIAFDGTQVNVTYTMVNRTASEITQWDMSVVPSIISKRQFFHQLAIQGVITQNEALAAASTGTLPTALANLVNGLPVAQQFGAKMILSGGTQFDRWHALSNALGTAFGWTTDQMNAFWVAASAL